MCAYQGCLHKVQISASEANEGHLMPNFGCFNFFQIFEIHKGLWCYTSYTLDINMFSTSMQEFGLKSHWQGLGPISVTDLSPFMGLNLTQSDSWLSLSLFVTGWAWKLRPSGLFAINYLWHSITYKVLHLNFDVRVYVVIVYIKVNC